jgi:lipopolysaccharide export LptBFGC system permease protein LptF
MLTAKLFAASAIIFAVCAFLTRCQILPRMNLYLPVRNIALGPFFWQLLGALVCAILALIYLTFARWMPRPLNQTTGLLSFMFIALAFIGWLIGGSFIGIDSPLSTWQAGTLFGTILSFLLGWALFAANVACTLFRIFRAHSSAR